MVEKRDIVIRKARTRISPNKIVDISIDGGKIIGIEERVQAKGEIEIDANEGLVTESFVDPHVHMCKVYTLQMIGEEAMKLYEGSEMGAAMTAIELASKVKERYNASWIYENAKKAVTLGIKYGTLHHRAFVDTDTKAKLEGIKALLKLKEEFKGTVNLEVVAFPQDGVIRDPGSEELVRKAIEMGADTVGGIPWIEYTDKDAHKHIDKMFEIAKEYGRGLAMLTDDAGDPNLRTTEMLAVKAIEEGWIGKVVACHARALQTYPQPTFKKLVALLKKADMSIVSDPQTGPMHAKGPELLNEGVNVALGQDDITDAYYPYGRGNMLEVAFLASHLFWETTLGGIEKLYDMVTKNAAKAMWLKNYGLRAGCEANLVVLNSNSVSDALRYHDAPRYVISGGKLVVENEFKTTYHLG